ncbi:nicotinate-nucleotide--dimethylbenzimidazole phosphoribosyltransferase [Lachnobacterium bovis]|uniref:nicotinate-nucleotide--dimethylbenzimidazole phosphoribosyltransferase n=1 Tax=Lachnobacterium bovis TaxID=140626 RepID=UPI00048EE428|nr:nicotinate-nucleotide--dimethylbenzimidazole phosphoribosyltransferase [Lachnobacterium bovis]
MNIHEIERLNIIQPDWRISDLVKDSLNNIAKPLDSLGRFEDIICQIGAIQGQINCKIDKKAVIVMCADNGVVEEGISQSQQNVTAAVAESMGKNTSSVGKMASVAGVRVIPVDIGINCKKNIPGVVNKKISLGTKNFAKEKAMTEKEASMAISVGISLVEQCKKFGYELIGTGEMGIGNTTTSSAITAALLKCPVKEVVGRGAGLSTLGLHKKRKVIEQAIKKHKLKEAEPFEILCAVGGLDIAGLVGVFIGGALYSIPIVIDGVISAIAALLAEKICPGTVDYMIASHRSREKAYDFIIKELDLNPIIDADLALGEGTGTIMLMSLLDLAMGVYNSPNTFEDIKIDAYKKQ